MALIAVLYDPMEQKVVEVDELTDSGCENATFQAKKLLEQIQERAQKLNDDDEDSESCHQCGKPFFVDDVGCAHHGAPGNQDHDADGDHVPYSLEDDE